MSFLIFPKASSLIHWKSQIKSARWEHVLSLCVPEVLRSNDGVRTNLCRIEREFIKCHSVFLQWTDDILSLLGFRRYLAISMTEKASREKFTAETLLLFLSPMPVTDGAMIFYYPCIRTWDTGRKRIYPFLQGPHVQGPNPPPAQRAPGQELWLQHVFPPCTSGLSKGVLWVSGRWASLPQDLSLCLSYPGLVHP